MSSWMKVALSLLVITGVGAGYLHLVNPELGRELLGDTPIAPAASVTTAYKWRDSKGNWQLTDRPPPTGTPYETLEANSDANILPSLNREKD